jgi:hypothetical protein
MKKTQKQSVLDALLSGIAVNGSNAYAITKKECNQGTLNLHKLIAMIRKLGYSVNEQWCINSKSNTRFKEFTITNKKQKKNGN